MERGQTNALGHRASGTLYGVAKGSVVLADIQRRRGVQENSRLRTH